MPTLEEVRSWKGEPVFGRDRKRIGPIAGIYAGRTSRAPAWAAVTTEQLGSRVSLLRDIPGLRA